MNIIVTENYAELSDKAAGIIAQKITEKPDAVLGLATGSTPLGLYREFIRLFGCKKIDLSQVVTFNLDEYVGLEAQNPQSYRYFMHKNLFDHVNIKPENIFIPNGQAENFEKECRDYENKIKKHGGIDLQILGIGHDGHIGFNEPGSLCDSRTRVVDLDAQTIQDNSRFFNNNLDQVPKQAITMGIATILDARACLLLASGANKAAIVARALQGPVTPAVPASFLQTHKNLIVILDKEAAANINKN